MDKKGDNDADASASTREQARDDREIYKSGSVSSRIEEFQNDQDIVDFRVKQDELRQEQPVSTTHCQIGAVTAVALASLGCKHVQWSMLGKILVSWILTIPTSAVIAAIILWIFRPAVCASCPWS